MNLLTLLFHFCSIHALFFLLRVLVALVAGVGIHLYRRRGARKGQHAGERQQRICSRIVLTAEGEEGNSLMHKTALTPEPPGGQQDVVPPVASERPEEWTHEEYLKLLEVVRDATGKEWEGIQRYIGMDRRAAQ